MKAKLTRDEVQSVRSMNDYWEEVSKRDFQDHVIYLSELRSLTQFIGAKNILLIVGEYAKNYKE
jgi:hypothetical protein